MLLCVQLIQLDVLRRDRESAALGHRVAGIHGEVDHHLFQLACVCLHCSQCRLELRDHLDVLAQKSPQQPLQIGHEFVEVEHAHVQDLLAAEREELTCEPGGAIGCLANLFKIGSQRRERRETIQEQADIAEDSGQHVVEIVGNAPCEPSHRLHLLRLQELALERAAFRHVPGIDHDATHNGVVEQVPPDGFDDPVGAVLMAKTQLEKAAALPVATPSANTASVAPTSSACTRSSIARPTRSSGA